MSRNPFLPILLAAAMVAQVVIAGWGHSHAHVAHGSHVHVDAAGHLHHHGSHEHLPPRNQPTDKDDCCICRHLALAAVLTFELESVATGDAAEAARYSESRLVSTPVIGLHRGRSPPELS